MIYAGIGPLLWGDDLEAATKAVKSAVDARVASGDHKVAFIAFEDPAGESVRGCDWHPNAAGQAHMAEILSTRIETDLEWDRHE